MKKKIFAVCLAVCLLAIGVSGTLAYMTDTEARTNTFTAGKVGLTLDEAKIKHDDDTASATFGDLIADGTARVVPGDAAQNYHLYPDMTVTKDPTITIDADSENAWVAAKVTITGDIHGLIGVPGYDNIDISLLASGGLMAKPATQENGWNGLSMVYKTEDCVIYQEADKTNKTWVLYIFMLEPMAKSESVTLFTTMYIPKEWNNDEMAKINGMNITVEAYAVQTNGFVDVYSALTTAFPTAFNFS